MNKHYLIISLSHSTKEHLVFWRADDNGYTTNPWGAGVYTEEQLKANPDYYNNGYETVAVEMVHDALEQVGLIFKPDLRKLVAYYKAHHKDIVRS